MWWLTRRGQGMAWIAWPVRCWARWPPSPSGTRCRTGCCSWRRPLPGTWAARLERAGYVTWAGRRPWRAARWVPADPDWAFAPLIRACSALDPVRPSDARHAVLAGLAVACGLGFRVAQYQAPAGLSPEQAAGRLDRGLQELIAQAQAAVDGAVLSHRV